MNMSLFFNIKEYPNETCLSVDDFKKELRALLIKYGFKKKPVKIYDGGGAYVGNEMYLTKDDKPDYRSSVKEIIHSIFGDLGL